jgi:hypothetical protein
MNLNPSQRPTTSLRLFTVTTFLGAALLFFVQPMVAKMLLPSFGGAPAVWTTCMLFFQAALLAGYGYAHTLTTHLGLRAQAVVHAVFLSLPLLVLPIAAPLGEATAEGTSPVVGVLGALLVSAALPFLVVSTSAPLLQRWFSSAGHTHSRDPYFLYAASNLGSMLALLAYPFLVEPNLALRRQGMVWAGGYCLLVLLTWVCAVQVWRGSGLARPAPAEEGPSAEPTGSVPQSASGFWPRMHWMALAFVPSSLLLSVTTHLTTDVAPVPLLWVVPLAIYLFSFVLAFGVLRERFRLAVRFLLPLVVLAQTFVLVASPPLGLAGLIAGGLFTLFVVSLACHATLAEKRPPVTQLTEFYFWVAVGGALGGVFNALLAPLLFNWLVEYPLALVLASLLTPPFRVRPSSRLGMTLDLLLPAALAGIAVVVLFGSSRGNMLLPFGVLTLLGLCLMTRPLRLGLGVAALFIVGFAFRQEREHMVYRERNFFGVVRVLQNEDYLALYHGSTMHGSQRSSPSPRVRDLPRGYFYPTGPAGQVFEAFFNTAPRRSVAIIGLGTGALASYGEKGQEFTFFELNPAVIRIASDPRYFSYLRDSPASIQVVLGDGRASLRKVPDRSYDLLILDAFSGDAIPTHLLTREAFDLYLSKLLPEGVLLLHISNNYLELGPVVARLAEATRLVALAQYNEPTPAEVREGKLASYWVVLARQMPYLGRLGQDKRWRSFAVSPRTELWTDDYSNLFGALKRR